MPLHPQAVTLLALVASFCDPEFRDTTPQAARDLRRTRLRPSLVELHEIRDVDAGGVACRLYRPNNDTGLGLLVYFHGGGWVIGDIESHDDVCRTLCRDAGIAVLSVDYRLAPEHSFPAGLDDCNSALQWASQHAAELGVRGDKIAVGGDSAGGNLAAVIAATTDVPLAFQLLVYPVTDGRCSTPSYAENANGYFLSALDMEWFYDLYLNGSEGTRTDPRVSPILLPQDAIARGPEALVITAGYDPLRDEGEQYATSLMRAGVRTTLSCYPGMFHGFFSLAFYLDDAKLVVAEAVAALKRSIG